MSDSVAVWGSWAPEQRAHSQSFQVISAEPWPSTRLTASRKAGQPQSGVALLWCLVVPVGGGLLEIKAICKQQMLCCCVRTGVLGRVLQSVWTALEPCPLADNVGSSEHFI